MNTDTETQKRTAQALVMTQFSEKMLTWYDTHRRTLPWRSPPGHTPNPYHIWLSEIMLQQTTVATVKSYYEKFLRLWPTVTALAAAQQEDVLKEWAGLGYYARARNLHKCASVVASEHKGLFPNTEDGLRALPGIGDYTAAAIASIAFNEPAAVVDGNIERIISRIYCIKTPLPAAKKPIKEYVRTLTPLDRPGDFAQAMMDLGASHCSPKKPSCMLCPVSEFCAANKARDMDSYPVKLPKKVKPTRRAVSFWLVHDGHLLLERRPAKGLLGGMPGLFSTEWREREDFPSSEEWEKSAPADEKWQIPEAVAKHTFTHFHLETKLAIATTRSRYNIPSGFWHPVNKIEEIGLPTVFKKMVSLAQS